MPCRKNQLLFETSFYYSTVNCRYIFEIVCSYQTFLVHVSYACLCCRPLPYTLHVPGEAGICLITKNKKEKVKALLKERGVEGITKILPLDKLKKEFRSYEARIRLVDMYDLFLTDDRVYHCVPQYLGKKFYLRKK